MRPEPDQIMRQVGEGIAASQQGERARARSIFDDDWERIGGDDGDPFHRCAIAHSMADVQDDPREELAWVLRALRAADLLTDERVEAGGVAGSARAFYPSLHLSLADVYLRLGEPKHALEDVQCGQAAVAALPDHGYGYGYGYGYGTMIRDALARIESELVDTRSGN